jgi:hypothetical protein
MKRHPDLSDGDRQRSRALSVIGVDDNLDRLIAETGHHRVKQGTRGRHDRGIASASDVTAYQTKQLIHRAAAILVELKPDCRGRNLPFNALLGRGDGCSVGNAEPRRFDGAERARSIAASLLAATMIGGLSK